MDHDDSGETISTVNGPDCIIACEVTDEQGISSPENAAFIAAARTDVLKLCTALRIAFEDGLSDEVVDRIEEVLTWRCQRVS